MNPDPILVLSVPGGTPRVREVMSEPMRDEDPLAPPEREREQDDDEDSREPRDESQEEEDSGSQEEEGSGSQEEEGSGSQEEEDSGSQEEEGSGSGKKSGSHMLHKGEFTAPSVGPHTVIDRPPPEERLDLDKISDTDAMGREKKRKVVGGTYGPTRTRVFATFATFFAVVAALAVGFYFLAKELDQPPKEQADEAPWAAEGTDQKRPRPLQ
jgi:hypothetical protein